MSKALIYFICLFCLIQWNTVIYAQSVLTLEEVLLSIKENNYDLQAARQNIAAAEVMTSKYNRGFMPTLGVGADLGYNLNGVKTVYNFNFPDLNIQNIQAFNGGVGVSSSYLLYDGGQRDLRNEKNLSNLELSQLQLNNVNQLLNFNAAQIYYSIAQTIYNVGLLGESLSVSKERLRRVETYYEYGGSTRVDVLNAEVDVARDSVNLITFKNDIDNLKWQLNQLTRIEGTNYEVDTTITLIHRMSNVRDLQSTMLQSNVELISLKKNMDLTNYDMKIASKTNSPQVTANGAYNINYNKNSSKSQLDFNRNNGLNLGVSANWNIFDGGQRKLQEQLVAVDQANASIAVKTKENELIVQLNRLWNTYQNNLLTLRIEKQNIQTNRENFEMVKTLFENGQQSSVEFRQAQLNLLNAQSQYFNVRVAAKLNEIELEFLLGR